MSEDNKNNGSKPDRPARNSNRPNRSKSRRRNNSSNKPRSNNPEAKKSNTGEKSNQAARPKKTSGSSNNKRRRRPQNRNNRKAPSGPQRVITKYLNILEQHLHARRKYFSLYYRADERQLAKLERNYETSMNKVRDFENGLNEKEKEIFKKHFDGLSPDEIYSNNHELPKMGEIEVKYEDIEDPHYLTSQSESNYSEDTEESVGSLEDYKAYKGL